MAAYRRNRLLDPRAEYTRRLASHTETIAAKERLHVRAGNLKLAAIVAGFAMLWLCFARNLFASVWLAAPVVAYFALAVWHERILHARARAESASAFYRRGIARIEDRWAGTGQSGDRFRDANHLYTDDLDIFGRGCLFELLSTARLPMGEDCLAQWLRFPSPVAEVVRRQEFVADLRDRVDLREAIAVAGEALRVRLNPVSLTTWAEGTGVMPSAAWRGVAIVLSLAFAGAMIYALARLAYTPILIVLLIESFLWRWLQPRTLTFIRAVNCNAEGLVLFSQILERLEKESFDSVRLRGYVEDLNHGREPASRAIRRLARVVYWIDSCEGLYARLLNIPTLFTVQVGFAADAWRRESGAKIRKWSEIVAEMEALLSLASYSFEHPGDPFPEFVETHQNVRQNGQPDGEPDPQPDTQQDDPQAGALFDGCELGHPLIAAAHCVRNSVRLDRETRLLLVSGSNMSGKSTLLRTVGINAVLACAGAPVRAKSLRMSPLVLGTRIRSTDSLQEGRSNFYTEILRIRKVFELADRGYALLYLFDELLEGTNSKDRRIGAEGLLRALVSRNAVGIVSTHDLALTGITVALGGVVRNQHFQDSVVNGQMRFDYKLQDGVVAKSNALELMRLIGLKV